MAKGLLNHWETWDLPQAKEPQDRRCAEYLKSGRASAIEAQLLGLLDKMGCWVQNSGAFSGRAPQG